MGRAPCCEKLGLKRGPWSSEEDQLLIAYIQKFGHGNWRALPKLAGLLRCGKSCRLRWTNYLRPDIKRGNFTQEEEDTIFQLHQSLGNRWSTIAAKLPGRTDNEIKNIWHTHLKKKLSQDQSSEPHLQKSQSDLNNKESKSKSKSKSKSRSRSRSRPRSKPKSKSKTAPEPKNPSTPENVENPCNFALSPQPCSSEPTSVVESGTTSEYIPMDNNIKEDEYTQSWGSFPNTDEILWSDFMPEQFNITDDFSIMETDQLPGPSINTQSSLNNDSVDFWYELFAQSHQLVDIPNF